MEMLYSKLVMSLMAAYVHMQSGAFITNKVQVIFLPGGLFMLFTALCFRITFEQPAS